MHARLTIAALLLLAMVGQPMPLWAQAAAFLDSVRELATASARSGSARADGIQAATRQMRASLTEWDRLLADAQRRVDREAPTADAARARGLHLEMATAYRLRGQLDDVLRELDAAISQNAADPQVLLLRALTLEAAGRDESRGLFSAAFAADVSNPVTAYYVVDRVNGAEARARAQSALASWYERLDVRAARPTAPPFPVLDAVPDTLAPTPIVADEALRVAFAQVAARKYGNAVGTLEALAPEAGSAAGPRASFARGQRDEAEHRIADARRAYAETLQGTLAGRHLLHSGIARLAQVEGDMAGAIAAFRAAARLAPNDATPHKELAGAYAAEARYDDAFAELSAALLIDPLDAHAHAAVGSVFIDAGRHAEAVVALTRAVTLSPDRHEARYALARALMNLGRRDEADRQLALFESARLAALERRRAGIAREVEREEAARVRRPAEARPR
jgi:Flp pilus assembly protein TadD